MLAQATRPFTGTFTNLCFGIYREENNKSWDKYPVFLGASGIVGRKSRSS